MKKLFLFLFPVIFFACKSAPPKDIAFFQDIDKYKEQLANLNPENMENMEYTIKSGDQLIITVTSSTIHQNVVAQYNLPLVSYKSPGETSMSEAPSLMTYAVDTEGYINFPKLGKVKLAGLKKSEAIQYLTEMLILNDPELRSPIVNIQTTSFTVSIIGEVNSPCYITINNEKFSIMEALANAGGLSIYGDRKNVLLIRENNGAKETVRLDLTSSDIFFSPYYYLQQGDLIIVDPNDTQKRASKYGTEENYRLSVYSLVFSALSVIASTVITIISINK